jgi:RNA polymerase sigma-70 factor (ECF subfamily)
LQAYLNSGTRRPDPDLGVDWAQGCIDRVKVVDSGHLELVFASARSGDQQAMSMLFRALNPSLTHYVRRHALDTADDLVSETWMAAAEAFPGFDCDAEGFRAWLFTVARRRIADHYRRSARRPQLLVLSDEHDQAAPYDTAQSALDALSTDAAIDALISRLPPDHAEVVFLRVVAGLSVEHVAEVMGRSSGSVRVLQHRALKRLASSWDRGAVTR